MNQRYPSALLENAVNELASLPGVGRKTALRLALYMLRRDVGYTENFAAALVALRRDVKYCKVCHNICDDEVCSICANPSRDHSLVCVVENIKEVMAIENTVAYTMCWAGSSRRWMVSDRATCVSTVWCDVWPKVR